MGGRGTSGGGIEKSRLPDLEGSVKQIKWANDLREDYLKHIKFAEYMLDWYEKKADKLEEEYATLKKDYDAEELEGIKRNYDRNRFLDLSSELDHIARVTSDAFVDLEKFIRSDQSGALEKKLDMYYGFKSPVRLRKNAAEHEKKRVYEGRKNAKNVLKEAKKYVYEEKSSKKWIEARKYIHGYTIKGINDIKFEYDD